MNQLTSTHIPSPKNTKTFGPFEESVNAQRRINNGLRSTETRYRRNTYNDVTRKFGARRKILLMVLV